MSDPNFDGLCGIIADFASSDLRLRCNFPLGHGGDRSYEKHRKHFLIMGGITRTECIDRAMRGGKGAVAARAMLGIPDGCICQPIFGRTDTDMSFELKDYIFKPDCPAHTKPVPELKTAEVASVEVFRMMCGKVACSHCGHTQSAQGYHHEQEEIPLRDYAVRCNACGSPLPPRKGSGH